MKATPAAAILAALLFLGLVSCSSWGWGLLSSTEVHEIRIILPEAPSSWAALAGLRMSLSWRDPGGCLRRAEAEAGSYIDIEVERGFPQALLAQTFSSGKQLLPAGALYPEALVGGKVDELRLDWRGVYAASVALALEGGGIDPSGFDLYALVDGAIARAGDPWLVAPLEAARRLAEGSFRIDRYKAPKRFDLSLPGPAPWIPESPFASAPEGEALSVKLPEGLWRFVGEGRELFASVDAKGAAIFALR